MYIPPKAPGPGLPSQAQSDFPFPFCSDFLFSQTPLQKKARPRCVGQSPEESNSLRHRIENFGPQNDQSQEARKLGRKVLFWPLSAQPLSLAPRQRLGSLGSAPKKGISFLRKRKEPSASALRPAALRCPAALCAPPKVSAKRRRSYWPGPGFSPSWVSAAWLGAIHRKIRGRHRLPGRLGRQCQTSVRVQCAADPETPPKAPGICVPCRKPRRAHLGAAFDTGPHSAELVPSLRAGRLRGSGSPSPRQPRHHAHRCPGQGWWST